MPKKKASSRKTAARKPRAKKAASKKTSQPVYLREIHITYKKRRVSSKSPINKPLKSVDLVVELFRDLENETKEKLIAISLDSKLKIITFEVVSIGNVRMAMARPFEIVRTPVVVNANGLILVHNHPSGDPTPSEEDKRLTEKVDQFCHDGGIDFYDHIIIGRDGYFSFAQHGLLISDIE